MEIEVSDVVRSIRGRDAGACFIVTATDGEYAFLADGRGRRLEKPKKKKLKHISFALRSEGRTFQKLRDGDKVTNSEIRRALNDISEEPEVKGGMPHGER